MLIVLIKNRSTVIICNRPQITFRCIVIPQCLDIAVAFAFVMDPVNNTIQILEFIHSSDAICNTGNITAVRRGVINDNAALFRLIILDFRQTPLSIKVTSITIFIFDAILFRAASCRGKFQFHAGLILIGSG